MARFLEYADQLTDERRPIGERIAASGSLTRWALLGCLAKHAQWFDAWKEEVALGLGLGCNGLLRGYRAWLLAQERKLDRGAKKPEPKPEPKPERDDDTLRVA